MRRWLRGKPGGVAAFLVIAALVAGGLGWATAAALRLEREQWEQQAAGERADRLRLALWRLDSRISPLLAREDARPFDHYTAIFASPLAFDNNGACRPAGTVMEPSPLLSVELPDWMLLHFQVDAGAGWASPQVPQPSLAAKLSNQRVQTPMGNVTAARKEVLDEIQKALPPPVLLSCPREHLQPATLHDKTLLIARLREEVNRNWTGGQGGRAAPNNPPDQQLQPQQSEFLARKDQKEKVQNEGKNYNTLMNPSVALGNLRHNGEDWLSNTVQVVGGTEALVDLTPMAPVWMRGNNGRDYLLLVRLVKIQEQEICQGIVLDAERLEQLLAEEVADLFPGSRPVPVRDDVPPEPERTMAALPFQLNPAPEEFTLPDPGWTTLRVGLASAWAAALVGLAAVALGGWSLIDLSERRIRFVSAVTHELRTPLTTLRLYLDMLTGGMVREEKQRAEYLRTLHAEADRLNRLVSNVLDYSRLENQRPRLSRERVPIAGLLAQVSATWQRHCQDSEKELIVENRLGDQAALWTDGGLVQQVLGILIDNACKYSRDAEDRRLWLRAFGEEGRAVLEVEDRGPGVPARERRSIFRAFRRGRGADVTAGGVGLGLALARRWVRLLGGRLALCPGCPQGGACFRVELPHLENFPPFTGCREPGS
jgi:signal transduction histidine kinase